MAFNIKELSKNISDIYLLYPFDYQESLGLDGYYYLFFVADYKHPKTRNIVHLVEKLGFENYDNIGNHCYAHYYRIKM